LSRIRGVAARRLSRELALQGRSYYAVRSGLTS
jgi:hypothetical protein